ncbi:MAG: hypothetical protein M1536_08060 [Firmicutes bacterium]|nr:hypothetical protein [Bacillota bacterium]
MKNLGKIILAVFILSLFAGSTANAFSLFGKNKPVEIQPAKFEIELYAKQEDGNVSYENTIKDLKGKDLYRVSVEPKKGILENATGVISWEVNVVSLKDKGKNLLKKESKNVAPQPYMIQCWDLEYPSGSVFGTTRNFTFDNVDCTVKIISWVSYDQKTFESLKLEISFNNKEKKK